jgi:DNA-binding NarL/FixJ family response regulator
MHPLQQRRKPPPRSLDGGARSTLQAQATLVIATGSGLLEAGLQVVLKQVPELLLLSSANDVPTAVKLLRMHRPNVFVVDQELTGEIRALYRETYRPRVLIISTMKHLGTEPVCGSDCACGFMSDRAPIKHIRSALRIIGACTSEQLGGGYCASCPLRSSIGLPTLPLSEREYAVFERIGHGDANQQIADKFDRSVKTIETHRESIKRKLGLESAAALNEAAIAWKRGEYVPPAHEASRRAPRKR